MKQKLLLLLLSLVFQMGCTKDKFEYTLPAITQKGANTVGCKVDDKVCIPHGASIFSPYTKSLCYNELTGELKLGALFIPNSNDIKNKIPRLGISLTANNILSTGNFSEFSGSISIGYFDENGGQLPEKEYTYLQQSTGLLQITNLDKQNNVISGLFNFDGVLFLGLGEYDSSQLAKVTNGRFDIHYNEDGTCILEY